MTITAAETTGTVTIATLSDGRTVIARNVGDRWTGKMVEVAHIDAQTLVIGELITLRGGTSHRLALEEAAEKLAA